MPRIMRLFIIQSLSGFGIAAAFTALLLWLNFGNSAYLVQNTDVGPLAVVLFWLFNGLVFGAVQFGVSLMSLRDDAPPSRGPGQRVAVTAQAQSAQHPSR